MRIEELVGRRIREAREGAKLSQEELGREMGRYLARPWPGQQVSVAEDGGRKFSARELFALCLILERPASFFFAPVSWSPIEVEGNEREVTAAYADAVQLWGDRGTSSAPLVASITRGMPDRLREAEEALRTAREELERLTAGLRQGATPPAMPDVEAGTQLYDVQGQPISGYEGDEYDTTAAPSEEEAPR